MSPAKLRKIDCQVAEHVMGWRWVEGSHPDVGLTYSRWLLPPHMGVEGVRPGEWTDYCPQEPDDRLTLFDVPRYSTDMTEAWEVVEALRDRVCVSVRTVNDWTEDQYVCRLTGLRQDDTLLYAYAATAALAICHAALQLPRRPG